MKDSLDTSDALGFTDVLFNIGLLVMLLLMVGQTNSASGWDALGSREGPLEPDLTVRVTSAEGGSLRLEAQTRSSRELRPCTIARIGDLASPPDVHCIRLIVAPEVPYGDLHRLERSLRAIAVGSTIPKQIQRVVCQGGSR